MNRYRRRLAALEAGRFRLEGHGACVMLVSMFHPNAQPGQLLFAGLPGMTVPDDLAELIRAGRIGGVTLFARNVSTPDETRALIDELHGLAPASAPLCVAIDQEGGRVQRLRAPWTVFPPMRAVGERDDVQLTESVGRAIGIELRDLGVDLNFAPCCDVDSNPDNPVIGDRSFGRTPQAVARQAVAFIRGLQSAGVAGCAKHFPGHGDTCVDSHLELPRLDIALDRLETIELPPFRAALEARVATAMSAHVVLESIDPDRPATLSPPVISLLRDGMEYGGLLFSDDLEMKAISDHFTGAEVVEAALTAGIDAFLVCSDAELRDEILHALESQRHDRLSPHLNRLRNFKARWVLGARPEGSVRGAPPYPEHQALADRLGC